MQSIMDRIIDQIEYKNSEHLNFLAIVTAILLGVLLLLVPIQYVIITVLAVAALAFFIIKPHYCYYLVIWTIPFMDKLESLPVALSINEIMIGICLFVVIVNIFKNYEKPYLKTKIDKWILVISLIFLCSSMISVNPLAIITFFRFFESIIVYYLTVYFIRVKKITYSQIVSQIIFIGLFEAILSVVQSLTGIGAYDCTNFLAEAHNYFKVGTPTDRSYFQYLGLGGLNAYQGLGTFIQFNMLGHFLSALIAVLLPICIYKCKNRKSNIFIIIMLISGLITTYSRGALLSLIIVSFLYLFFTQKDRYRFYMTTLIACIILVPLIIFLIAHGYTHTLNSRSNMWHLAYRIITQDWKTLLFGGGLSSYELLAFKYIPANVGPSEYVFWYPHSFYFAVMQELGVIGFIIFFSFPICLARNAIKNINHSTGLIRILNLSLCLFLTSFFTVSIFDANYTHPFFKVLLFLILGLVYAKDYRKNSEAY